MIGWWRRYVAERDAAREREFTMAIQPLVDEILAKEQRQEAAYVDCLRRELEKQFSEVQIDYILSVIATARDTAFSIPVPPKETLV